MKLYMILLIAVLISCLIVDSDAAKSSLKKKKKKTTPTTTTTTEIPTTSRDSLVHLDDELFGNSSNPKIKSIFGLLPIPDSCINIPILNKEVCACLAGNHENLDQNLFRQEVEKIKNTQFDYGWVSYECITIPVVHVEVCACSPA